jgi:2-polyprenyl-6-methoxyphenol hydroxylase-like FAD-dependent oxidoreductase
MMSDTRPVQTRCAIVGGGPAGVMLGYLLARAGVEVEVLEKHGDFFRDFRGDTVHPSTMTVLHELGILDEFLKIPHSRVEQIGGRIGKDAISIGDFRHIPARTKFLALMPQWDFLNFLASQGKKFPGFSLRMNANATGAIEENGRIVGVRATTPDGPLEIRADLVVATDGRHSTMREALGITPLDLGAPMDVLWFSLPREATDTAAALGYIGAGYILVTINRDDYWQCGLVIPKGLADDVKANNIETLREKVLAVAPVFANRVERIASWDNVKLLSVAVDRLERWYRTGILFIGDAAHAMSPVGGVGINLAVQDAVATARILRPYFASPGSIGDDALALVQERRLWPTEMTQRIQIFAQNRIISKVLTSNAAPTGAPWPLRLFSAFPLLQMIPACVVGIGLRPEHVD